MEIQHLSDSHSGEKKLEGKYHQRSSQKNFRLEGHEFLDAKGH